MTTNKKSLTKNSGGSIAQDQLRHQLADIDACPEAVLVREIVQLSHKNFSIDSQFYPLGSCTMKYNPRCLNTLVSMRHYANIHPLTSTNLMQGLLSHLYHLQTLCQSLTGMDAVSLTPMAGAQGELVGMAMIKAYLQDIGQSQRRIVLIPDSAHGTNFKSAKLCGFTIVVIPTKPNGNIDLAAINDHCNDQLAALMLTNPSTLGVFEKDILTIADRVHQAGGLLYYDGANLNATLGHYRPGDTGFDVLHLNVHKTFATPHGGGGPGAGPVACKARLTPYLPIPRISKNKDGYLLQTQQSWPKSIGRLSTFMGNIGVLLRAYGYLRLLGKKGCQRVGEIASLNAAYLRHHLQTIGYRLAYPKKNASHEFVISCDQIFKDTQVRALDICKRLIDFNIHPPTMYFPTNVPECLLIEPTETENKVTLDYFIEAMRQIYHEAYHEPNKLQSAPNHGPLGRVDEAKAARLILRQST